MELMVIDVLAPDARRPTPDAREIWTLTATAYTVHADGRLTVGLADGSQRTFEVEDWVDVRPHSG